MKDAHDPFQLALEAAPGGVLLSNAGGVVTFVNRALERQFGYSPGELIGQPVNLLLPDLSRFAPAIGGAPDPGAQASTSTGVDSPGGPVLTGRRKDGSLLPVEVGLSTVFTQGRELTVAWVSDASTRHPLEESHQREVQERLAFEQLVSEISASFVNLAAADVDQAIYDAQHRISAVLDFDRTLLFEWRDEDLVLTHRWSRTPEAPLPAGVSVARLFPWTAAKLIRGEIVAYSSPEEIPDPIERESVRRHHTQSRIAFPLSIGGSVIGAVSFASTSRERYWPQAMVSRLTLLTQVFAGALARKRADAALRASEDRFRTLADEAPVLIWVSGVDKQCTWFNRRWLAFVGRSMPEELGNGWADHVHRDDLDAWLATFNKAFEARVPFTREYRLRRHDGASRWVLDNGTPNYSADGVFHGYLGSCLDITENKESNLRLDLLHRVTRSIGGREDLKAINKVVLKALEESVEIDFGCFCDFDAVNHSLTLTHLGPGSQAFADRVHLRERSVLPITEQELALAISTDLVYDPNLALATTPFRVELAAAGLSSMVLTPLRVESNVFGVLIVARRQPDAFSRGEREFFRRLSEHVALAAHQTKLNFLLQRAYDDLRHSQQATMEQERLRIIGQMASGIAHDINNGLSPVSLYAEALLESEPALTADAREYLGTIRRAVDDVGQTLDRLSDFARHREPGMKLAPVNLNALVEQVKALTRARWKDMPLMRGTVIEFETRLDPDLPSVAGVEAELRDALTNLVINSCDAMPSGGKIALVTRVRNRRAGYAPIVQLELTDTGGGMTEETRRRCLEPFFTTKGTRGTGLGLAMVYGVAQRHRAHVDIQSRLGNGTTVRIDFPAVAPADSIATASPVPAALRQLHILVVDDDQVLVRSLRDVLEQDGHHVTAAGGGREGLEMLRQATADGLAFDVVITDLAMPHVAGDTVAAAVKRQSESTCVILLTGWGRRMAAGDDLPPCVDQVLSKPPRLHELRSAIATAAGARQPR